MTLSLLMNSVLQHQLIYFEISWKSPTWQILTCLRKWAKNLPYACLVIRFNENLSFNKASKINNLVINKKNSSIASKWHCHCLILSFSSVTIRQWQRDFEAMDLIFASNSLFAIASHLTLLYGIVYTPNFHRSKNLFFDLAASRTYRPIHCKIKQKISDVTKVLMTLRQTRIMSTRRIMQKWNK